MKSAIFFILAIFFLHYGCQAQVDLASKIVYNSFEIVKNQSPNSSFSIGVSKSIVLGNYGNPLSTEIMPWDDYPSEISGWKYGNNYIYIDNEREVLFGFKIVDSNFYIIYNDQSIKVGDNISILSNIFPASYQNKYDDLISIELTTTNGEALDEMLEVYYDPSSNIITGLSIGYR
ncbi:MAG TPA: hypothetical protein VL125_17110 [Pelobium sp.]|nr:hypothetical protein [Pelobium sp.]